MNGYNTKSIQFIPKQEARTLVEHSGETAGFVLPSLANL